MQYSTDHMQSTPSLILAEAAVDAEDYYQEPAEDREDYAADAEKKLGFDVLPSQAEFSLHEAGRLRRPSYTET